MQKLDGISMSKQLNKKNKELASDLSKIRKQIDSIDYQIQTLINDRARCAQKVGLSKGVDSSTIDYYRPEREAEVLRSVLNRNEGPLRDEEILRLFREIMSACLAQQEPLKVGYLGPEGTFTQAAVFKHFGHSVSALPFGTIDEVFQEVETKIADFGVVPIENSTEGTVNNTLDMFIASPLKICGEIELLIEHNLIGKMKSIEGISRVCAHEQALAQCRGWLREHLPDIELIGVSSNAIGARRARDEVGTAAIGGDTASEVYDLNILVKNIEDRSNNATRFMVIGRSLLTSSGDDKTTILVSTNETDDAGALYSLLEPLAKQGINITRIESRPSRKKNWEYVFFLDLDGHAEEKPLSKVLETVKEKSSLFRILGAYPKVVK